MFLLRKMGTNDTILNTSTLQTIVDRPENYPHFHAGNELIKWTALIVILVGTTGNILSFIVMSRRSIRTSSASVYFRAIAVMDTMMLWTGHFTHWLRVVSGISVENLTSWSCKAYYFLLYTGGDLAVWSILAVTVDRFIAVVFPMKAKQLCSVKRAIFAMLFTAALAIGKNLHLLWTRGPQYGDNHTSQYMTKTCGYPTKNFEEFEKYFRPWIALSLYAFLPIAFIFTFNVIIVVRLAELRRKREKRQETLSSSSSNVKQKNSAVSAMTAMFLSVSFVLLLLLTPSISIYVSIPYWPKDAKTQATLALILAITDTCVYIEHSINFFLYCLTGRKVST